MNLIMEPKKSKVPSNPPAGSISALQAKMSKIDEKKDESDDYSEIDDEVDDEFEQR